jgi:hypothetical protein
VGYHGYPRATQDLDVWIAKSDLNARKIVAAIREFGFDVPNLSKALFLRPGKIIQMGVPPLCIDILLDISGVSFDECFRGRIQVDWDGVPVNLISLKHLKRNKRASGRHKDLDDLEQLA